MINVENPFRFLLLFDYLNKKERAAHICDFRLMQSSIGS